ncbi:hypothetical protein [Streptodolium elevatio]|uniref:Uncharacterized protein n=1 Tax=Streptodolium elevatio TaxID=3157996 RepID=A0ABV3DQN4_9ACTN
MTASQQPSESDPFKDLVLDEEFVRGAGRREPSARARMLAERWRDEPPQAVGFREAADTPQPTRRPRRGFRRRRTDPWGRPVRRDRTNLKIAVWFVLLVALLLVANRQDTFRDLLGGNNHGEEGLTDSAPMTAQPSVSGIASAAAPLPPTLQPVDPDRPTRENPFAGSPALNYADGAAGIVLPEAKQVKGYSTAQVQAALEATRDLLIAANLDPAALRGETPAAFRALVDPQQGELLDELEAAYARFTKENDPLLTIARFDPRETELVGSVVKVSGIMAYALDDEGMLTVTADYSFVYPVAKVGQADREVTRTLVRRALETKVYKGPSYEPSTEGKVWISSRNSDFANSSCDVDDGFLHPYFASDPEQKTKPSGAPFDPYDRSQPLETAAPSPDATTAPDSCGLLARI